MDIRAFGRECFRGRLIMGMRGLNARHPWSHNDFFHPWIVTKLPASRCSALDIGCGRGELLAVLAEHFVHVQGTDIDETMRRRASSRCAGLPNVTVVGAQSEVMVQSVDLVMMIAVLHHLDAEKALTGVVRMLVPGGRFLCVGLARPVSPVDQLWDIASMVTNPMIGYVRHPWVSYTAAKTPPFPVKDPELSFDQLRVIVERVMPGAWMRHRLGFRHTIEWTKPVAPDG